jgi:hypothetical protein
MKYFRAAVVVFASLLSFARAQDEEDQSRRTPPVEIPDFSNLDEYIYEPKSTVTLGFRHLSGAKTKFSGQGSIASPENPGPATGANLDRIYHDGSVHPDARSTARLDASGNPIIDPESGTQIFDPIAPDGRTNSWNYSDNKMRDAVPGYMAFHTYSADITDTAARAQNGSSTNGMELAVSRDMGKLFGTRMTWNLVAGMSVNDISAKMSDTVRANLTTTTDLFSLFGQTAPDAPYVAPSSATVNVVDAAGNPVLNSDGSAQTVTVDTTVLLANEPAQRTTSVASNATSVTNHWKVKGAYYTFRAGPTVWIPITNRFRASVSIGAAMIYAGTTYTVTESFTPDIGSDISDTNSSITSKLLPGYYADATLQYDLTDRTGFYAGAVFQSAGSYDQKVDVTSAHYATKVDLGNQNGLRAGLSIRF